MPERESRRPWRAQARRLGRSAPDLCGWKREARKRRQSGLEEKNCVSPGGPGGQKRRRRAGLDTAPKGASGKGKRPETRDAEIAPVEDLGG